MLRRQAVKAIPDFRQGDGGDEQVSRALSVRPSNESRFGSWFERLADRVRPGVPAIVETGEIIQTVRPTPPENLRHATFCSIAEKWASVSSRLVA